MLNDPGLWVTWLAVGGAAVVQGCTGFGFAMLVVPPLLWRHSAAETVPLVGLLSLVNSSYVALRARRHIERRAVGRLLAGALVGMPFGVLMLARLDGPGFKAAIGLIMLVLASALAVGWRASVSQPWRVTPAVGALSGFLAGSSSLTGPPVILFLVNQATPKLAFRATLVAYFISLGVFTQTLFYFTGLLNAQVLRLWLVHVPWLIVGTLVGDAVAGRVPEASFRRLAAILAAVMGAVLFVQNGIAAVS